MRSRLMFMVLACAALPCVGGGQAGAHTHLRIGLVIPPASANSRAAASIARGVRLGAAESKQTATLFGDDVELFEITGTGDGAVAAAEQLLSERQVQVLIGAASGDVDALSRFAEARHVLFLNPASRSQSLRAACRHYTFNIEASDATYANVLRLGGNPETPSAPVNRNASLRLDSVVLWSSSLQRFGASQINDRYRVMFREGMDGGAWAGWAAIKIVADAALRARSTSPTRLVTYLESPTTAFDGHKGWQLSFRRTDHQLRQPVYIVVTTVRAGAPNQALRDVPELRAPVNSSDGDDSRAADQVLDRLIGPDTPRICGRQPK